MSKGSATEIQISPDMSIEETVGRKAIVQRKKDQDDRNNSSIIKKLNFEKGPYKLGRQIRYKLNEKWNDGGSHY